MVPVNAKVQTLMQLGQAQALIQQSFCKGQKAGQVIEAHVAMQKAITEMGQTVTALTAEKGECDAGSAWRCYQCGKNFRAQCPLSGTTANLTAEVIQSLKKFKLQEFSVKEPAVGLKKTLCSTSQGTQT